MHDPNPKSWVRRKTYIVAPLVILGSALVSGSLFAGSSPVGVSVRGKVTGWNKLLPQVYADAAADPHRYTWRETSPW